MVWFGPQPCNCQCEDDDEPDNPECLCAESDEYVSPQYVEEYEIVISDIPDTYNESRTSDGVSLLATSNSEITLELSGFAALNGTYTTSLKDPEDGTSCASDENDCVFDDSAAGCVWEGILMQVPITGTLYYYNYYEFFGDDPVIEERTYDLYGTAAISGTGKPEFLICSFEAYRIVNGDCRAHGGGGFTLFKELNTTDAMSFPGGKRYTCTTGSLYYNNPPDIEPWAIIPGIINSEMIFGGNGYTVDPCYTPSGTPALTPGLYWGPYCNDPNCNFTTAISIDGCSGAYTITTFLGGGGVVLEGTNNITFDYDGFACTIESNCTLSS